MQKQIILINNNICIVIDTNAPLQKKFYVKCYFLPLVM